MIELELQDRVALVTLNRPEKRNAVDTQACVDLSAAIDAARHAFDGTDWPTTAGKARSAIL